MKFETAGKISEQGTVFGATGGKVELSGALTSADIRNFVEKNFSKIDKDMDGIVQVGELNAWKPDNEKDRLSVKYLKEKMKEIRVLSNDQTGFENGVSTDDLRQFEIIHGADYEEKQARLREISRTFLDNMSKIDKDQNGCVTLTELELAGHDPNLDAGAKYMIEFMRKGFSSFAENRGRDYYGINRDSARDLGRFYNATAANRYQMNFVAFGAGLGTTSVLGMAALAASTAALTNPVTLLGMGIAGGFCWAATNNFHNHEKKRHNEMRARAWTLLNETDSERKTGT